VHTVTFPYKVGKNSTFYSSGGILIVMKKIPAYENIFELSSLKLCGMTDFLEVIQVEKLMNKTQRKIIEILKSHNGYRIQRDLLNEIGVDKSTLISNIKKLEESGLVFTDRGSAKDIFLNPAWFRRSELFKAVRKNLLENAQLSREVEKLLEEIDLQKSLIFERREKRARAKT
jgi:DNA-binding PadR family transcriptional regulator